MEIKRAIIVGIFILFMAAGFVFYFAIYIKEPINGDAISNITDSHGCLIHQGYTWNETEESCMKGWLSGRRMYQILDFSSCESAGYPVNITNTSNSSSPKFCIAPNGTSFVQNLITNETTINENFTNATSSNVSNNSEEHYFINMTITNLSKNQTSLGNNTDTINSRIYYNLSKY